MEAEGFSETLVLHPFMDNAPGTVRRFTQTVLLWIIIEQQIVRSDQLIVRKLNNLSGCSEINRLKSSCLFLGSSLGPRKN